MLQHWVRDRKGHRIALEHAVKRQCRDTALLYGLDDRGLLAPGYLADLNVIDMDAIKLGKPWLAFDLPAGGSEPLASVPIPIKAAEKLPDTPAEWRGRIDHPASSEEHTSEL